MWASQVMLVVKNPPANAGDIRDVGLIPGSGRFPGGRHGTHSSILAWKIPQTEEPGRPHSIGVRRTDRTKHTCIQREICKVNKNYSLILIGKAIPMWL